MEMFSERSGRGEGFRAATRVQGTAESASVLPWALPPVNSGAKPFVVPAVKTYLHLPPAFACAGPVAVTNAGAGFRSSNLNEAAVSQTSADATRAAHADDELSALELAAEVLLREKDSVTMAYLDEIEEKTDRFLETLRFDRSAIPDDYLDTPPTRPDAVLNNVALISHMIAEVFNPASTIHTKLIQPLVRHVWETSLTPLLHDLQRMGNDIEVSLQRHVATTDERQVASPSRPGKSVVRESLRRLLTNIQRDVQYLLTIREQEQRWVTDAHAEVNAHAPADVVPVTGLIVGRLHRLENEHRTVIDHWKIVHTRT